MKIALINAEQNTLKVYLIYITAVHMHSVQYSQNNNIHIPISQNTVKVKQMTPNLLPNSGTESLFGSRAGYKPL